MKDNVLQYQSDKFIMKEYPLKMCKAYEESIKEESNPQSYSISHHTHNISFSSHHTDGVQTHKTGQTIWPWDDEQQNLENKQLRKTLQNFKNRPKINFLNELE